MGGYHQDFFPAGPPAQCAEPLDNKLCERIRKLAEFAARNGMYNHLIVCFQFGRFEADPGKGFCMQGLRS